MTDFSVGDLIAKHAEIKAYLDAENEKHDAACKPFNDALQTIKATIGAELQKQGLQNFKSDDGTAYLSTIMDAKVLDRGLFLDFVNKNDQWSMVTLKPLTDPVKDWLDVHNGVPPPGVDVSFSTRCNIRKS